MLHSSRFALSGLRANTFQTDSKCMAGMQEIGKAPIPALRANTPNVAYCAGGWLPDNASLAVDVLRIVIAAFLIRR